MNSRRATLIAALILMLIGEVCVMLRVYYHHEVQLAKGDSIWRMTYSVGFTAPRSGMHVSVAFPADTRHGRMFRQELFYTGLSPTRPHSLHSDLRDVNLVTKRHGDFTVAAEFDLHISPKSNWRSLSQAGPLSAQARADALKMAKGIQVDSPAVTVALQRLREGAKSEAELVDRLFQFCVADIVHRNDDAPEDAAGAIEQRQAVAGGRARALIAMCRAAKIPARPVTGFEIKQSSDLAPRVWVEVYTGGRWEPFDPDEGFARDLPANFLPVRREIGEIVHGPDLANLHATYAVKRIPPPAGALDTSRRSLIEILDFTRLPLETHHVLSLLLLMPLGALVTSIFRTIIGVPTFGTFTPTLLALSFVYADWRTGLVVFAVVLALGLTSRKLLDHLKLLMVPRLSIILTLVALCLVFGVSVMDFWHVTPSAQAVLLPMVILTMTIERFHITTEEDGLPHAVRLLIATMAVAFLCYLVLRWDQVGQLLLTYPEVHLFTISALMFIGRYTGYRLSELWRFRDFAEPRQ